MARLGRSGPGPGRADPADPVTGDAPVDSLLAHAVAWGAPAHLLHADRGPVPLDRLARFLRDAGVHLAGPLRATRVAGGRSNITLDVTDGAHRWAVRRPPTSGLTPSAHDMAREWRVTSALHSAGFPVPAPVVADLSGEVFGAPVTVTTWADGQVLRAASDLDVLTDDQLHRTVDATVRALADLHAVSPDEVGLADFGRPVGFLGRQVARWARQWTSVAAAPLPDLDRLVHRLVETTPDRTVAAVVHGDYRLDNLIVGARDPAHVVAVVDWELSTLGDPLTDLAMSCVYRHPALDVVLGFPAAWTSARLPTPSALAEGYCRHTGSALPHWEWFLGLAHLKLAVIAEGIAYRARRGAAADDTAARAGDAVAPLVAAGLAATA